MRYTYYFKDTNDVIISDPLTKNEYDNFMVDFKKLNDNYNFEIYLVGSYLSYLTKESTKYNDIDFFIMAEKIIDLDELTEFFKLFHELAKKYKFAYDLIYFMDATADDLNMNPKTPYIFNIESSRTIKLYHTKLEENSQLLPPKEISDSLIPDTVLFQSVFSGKTQSERFRNKNQTKSVFQKPIKIS
jgi:hypothetical protein